MPAPRVSVIVPVFNRPAFVRQAVDSALTQNCPGGFEVVVVDDGSTDETPAVLASYGDRIRVDDPLTLAHLRALSWIHRHHAALAEKRRAVQAGRRRPDAEIFAKFPLRLVPTYPGDERLASDFFAPFFASAPALVRTTLAEIFEGGA